MGDYTSRHGYEDVAKIFKGSELQKYFSRLASGELRCVSKPQYVDNIPKAVKGVVGELLRERGCAKSLIADLDLSSLLEREVAQLSGGELQRFAIAVTACTSGSRAYMFDEPSSFLDVRQRLNAARVIRGCLQSGESDAQNSEDKYVIVVEHDLSVLDYISDTLCFLYGKPSSYGVVTLPMGVREGINAFLSGYLPAEINIILSFEKLLSIYTKRTTRAAVGLLPFITVRLLGATSSGSSASGSGSGSGVLQEVVLDELLQVEVCHLVAFVGEKDGFERGVGVNVTPVILLLQVVVLDVLGQALGHIGATHLSSGRNAQELAQVVR